MTQHGTGRTMVGRSIAAAAAALAIVSFATACGGASASSQTGYSGNTLAAPATPAAAASPEGVTQTPWGPLSAADRELLVKVRLASLWEMPSAQQAVERAQSPKVRQVSAEIAAQHMALDEAVRSVAAKLQVELPVQPNSVQQEWMTEIGNATGANYDATYVRLLRFAHGQVFMLIGSVRGTTQNTLIRKFAEVGNKFVLNHMRLLESTGLTDGGSFPAPPTP